VYFAEPPPLAPTYRRSPFQVALLMTATLGLYVFVWAYWTRRWCASAIERDDQVLWKTIALVIPIFNFFLVYDLGSMIQGTVSRANLPAPRVALGLIGLTSFLFGIAGRLPVPWDYISFCSFIPFAILQWWLLRAESAIVGDGARPTRFHPLEWIVLVLGGAWWVLILIGMFARKTPLGVAWSGAIVALMAAALIASFGAGRRLVDSPPLRVDHSAS
jgi:hypothetical protein